MLVKRLVQDEGMTLAGARKRLRALGRQDVPPAVAERAGAESHSISSSVSPRALSTSEQVAVEPASTLPAAARAEVAWRADLLKIRQELSDLLKQLEGIIAPSPSPSRAPKPRSAVVTSALPSSAAAPSRTRLK
jgi:hypothetical protein